MTHTNSMTLEFVGPFAWPRLPDAPSIFDVPQARLAGIYLWTVPTSAGHLVYYVGETGRSFSARFLQHFLEHAAGFYHVHAPSEFAKGHRAELWPGRFDPQNRKSIAECVNEHTRLAPHIGALTSVYRFLVAPLTVDQRLRRRLEAALAAAFAESPGDAGQFQENGIRYQARKALEEPKSCQVMSRVIVVGLPRVVIA